MCRGPVFFAQTIPRILEMDHASGTTLERAQSRPTQGVEQPTSTHHCKLYTIPRHAYFALRGVIWWNKHCIRIFPGFPKDLKNRNYMTKKLRVKFALLYPAVLSIRQTEAGSSLMILKKHCNSSLF